MIPLITPAAMRAMEQRYFAETGTPSVALMERAAEALCELLLRRYGAGRRVFIACGPGGHGGDGYALARLYQAAGGRCSVVAAAPAATPDAVENRRRALAAGVSEGVGDEAPEIWVDALFGTGLSRAPSGAFADWIARMNADRARGSAVVAVDIPSGLDGGTGRAWERCVTADVTCAFQYAKPGHFLSDGLDVCGEVETPDIGIPPAFYPQGMPELMTEADVAAALPPLRRNRHKGDNGHLLIVAGSMGMAGAAALCAEAALRCGAGLVTVACPESVVPILQTLVPCAMALGMPERDGALSPDAAPALRKALEGKDAAVCGCGLSRRAAPEAVRAVLESGLPAVLDADALNLIAADDALRAALRPRHLITPHPGEAARLLGRRVTDPIEGALALRKLGCQALLKGATTVIPVADCPRLSASGGPGMAKGGSGDCLSGILGALVAQAARASAPEGAALAHLAAVGSELHGLSGELAQSRQGVRGMLSRDLVCALPEVLKRYE